MFRLQNALLMSFISLNIISAFAADQTGSASPQIPPVTITDKSGKPLPGSEVIAVLKNPPVVTAKSLPADKDGVARFHIDGELPAGEYELLLLSENKAPKIVQIALPTTSPLSFSQDDGEPITLNIRTAEGKPLPREIVPLVYPQSFGALLSSQLDKPTTSTPLIKSLGDGAYRLHLNETSEPLHLALTAPGIITGFITHLETTSTIQTKTASITLPRPATMDVQLQIPDKWTTIAKAQSQLLGLHRIISLNEDHALQVNLDVRKLNNAKLPTTRIDHLAPGQYIVALADKARSQNADGMKSGAFGMNQELTLAAGETTTILVTYDRFDPATVRGKFVAHVRVVRQNGSPFGDQPVELRYESSEFGTVALTTGTLDHEGRLSFPELSGDLPEEAEYYLHEGGDWGDEIGSFRFTDASTSETFTFTLSPREGDMAPDITLYDLNTTKSVNLSDFRGKVVFLDFWATWCGPCQEPMAHNQKILQTHGAAWKDKVVILGASVDETADTVIQHVKNNGWEKVTHYWCGPDGFQSTAAERYGVNSIPAALLIDQNGQILWRGHPGDYAVEEEIKKLLK